MAELFLARDSRTNELLVIKRILPYLSHEAEFVQMFLDEARIAAQLDHPNVVQVHELGKLEESIFIAMEFVDGIDLRKIVQEELKAQKAVPYAIAAWICARVCDGLYYAHNRVGLDGRPLELIHRDVSPQNVMVGYDGRVTLVDFGIAKANAYMERSKPGVIKGKFLYLSPEQLSQDRLDHRADLFAVGTMLYEVTTARSPFYKSTTEAVILAIRSEEPSPPHLIVPDYPLELSRIVMKCLTKDRSKRYQQANEIAADLDKFLRSYRPTEQADVAHYVATLFGDEGERTMLHIPSSPKSNATAPARPSVQEVSTKPTVPTVSGPPRTSSVFAPAPGRRVTSEASPASGAQFEDDEPATQMARPQDLAAASGVRPAPLATTASPFAATPMRRPSGESYASAGEPGSPEVTSTYTGHSEVSESTNSGATPSIEATPSTAPEKVSLRAPALVQDGPIFDELDPGPEPRTKAEGSRAERVRGPSSKQPSYRSRPPVPDEDEVSASQPSDDDDESTMDYSTLASGKRPASGIPPKRIIVAAVVLGALIIFAAAAIRVFRQSSRAENVPTPMAAPSARAEAPEVIDEPEAADPAVDPGSAAAALDAGARGEADPTAATAQAPTATTDAGVSGPSSISAAAIANPQTEPNTAAAASGSVPVKFVAASGTKIWSGKKQYVPAKRYELRPGTFAYRYQCPGRRGASGKGSVRIPGGAKKVFEVAISCRRK